VEDEHEVHVNNNIEKINSQFTDFFRTRWNRHCSSLLKKVLYTLENQSNGKREAIRELQPLVAAHKVT